MTSDLSSTQLKSHLFGALAYMFGCFSGIVLLR